MISILSHYRRVKTNGLSSFALKVTACVTMVIDHIGYLFYPEEIAFRIIGRISFPLFALLIAEGFDKTSNQFKYLKRLFIMGLVSQPIYAIFTGIVQGDPFIPNILFTLSLGLLSLMILKRGWHVAIRTVLIIAIILSSHFIGTDYGAYGVTLIITCYLFLKDRKLGWIALILLHLSKVLSGIILGTPLFQEYAILSLIPYGFYNRVQGKILPKWIFYWFYPVHILILLIIFAVTFSPK